MNTAPKTNHRVLITVAGSDPGLTVARAFVACGGHVVLADEATLNELAELIVCLSGETAIHASGQTVSLRDRKCITSTG